MFFEFNVNSFVRDEEEKGIIIIKKIELEKEILRISKFLIKNDAMFVSHLIMTEYLKQDV
jgi:hypothetical protein